MRGAGENADSDKDDLRMSQFVLFGQHDLDICPLLIVHHFPYFSAQQRNSRFARGIAPSTIPLCYVQRRESGKLQTNYPLKKPRWQASHNHLAFQFPGVEPEHFVCTATPGHPAVHSRGVCAMRV